MAYRRDDCFELVSINGEATTSEQLLLKHETDTVAKAVTAEYVMNTVVDDPDNWKIKVVIKGVVDGLNDTEALAAITEREANGLVMNVRAHISSIRRQYAMRNKQVKPFKVGADIRYMNDGEQAEITLLRYSYTRAAVENKSPSISLETF